MSRIKRLLREGLLDEMLFSTHVFDRLDDRVKAFPDEDISQGAKNFLSKYLKELKALDFNPNKSFAIKLLKLDINPRSEYFYRFEGRGYYRIRDFMGKDSTGNEIWAIVRGDEATTVMLRKSVQPLYGMRVDYFVRTPQELQVLRQKKLVLNKPTAQ